jgi:uncharacterized protein (DUF433 family)
MVLPATIGVIPLRQDEGDIVRVGDTRVTLDSVIWAFRGGATAEEIAQRYPTLKLRDVYAVISYYLHETNEVDLYLRQRQVAAAMVRADFEARHDPVGIRDRLLARRDRVGE